MAALSEGVRQLRTKFVPANPALPVTEIISLSLKYLILSANNIAEGAFALYLDFYRVTHLIVLAQ